MKDTYYHGSSDKVLKKGQYKILPPLHTNIIQEKGRKKNLDKVFFTKDIKSAKIYAGRAVQRFGGNPIIVRAIPMGEIEPVNTKDGTSVYQSDWAFFEPVGFKEWMEINESPLAHYSVQTSPRKEDERLYIKTKDGSPATKQKYVGGLFSAADTEVLSQPKTLKTLEQRLSKSGHNFNIIMMEYDHRYTPKHRDEFYEETVDQYMLDNNIQKEGHITFVKNGSSGDYLTPWMILHTLGHALTETNQKLVQGVSHCILSGERPPEYVHDLLTFKSARTAKVSISNPAEVKEVVHELVAEFLWHGRVRTNLERQKPIAECIENQIRNALDESVGKIIYDWA